MRTHPTSKWAATRRTNLGAHKKGVEGVGATGKSKATSSTNAKTAQGTGRTRTSHPLEDPAVGNPTDPQREIGMDAPLNAAPRRRALVDIRLRIDCPHLHSEEDRLLTRERNSDPHTNVQTIPSTTSNSADNQLVALVPTGVDQEMILALGTVLESAMTLPKRKGRQGRTRTKTEKTRKGGR